MGRRSQRERILVADDHPALNARFRLAFATRVARKWDGRCAAYANTDEVGGTR
jgi:hypothetical protein